MGICASSSTSKKSRVEGTNNCQDIQQDNEKFVRNSKVYFEAPVKSLAVATSDQNKASGTRFRSDSGTSSVPSNSTASNSFSAQLDSHDKSRSLRTEILEPRLIQDPGCLRKYSHIGESPATCKPEIRINSNNQPQTSKPSGPGLLRTPQLVECGRMAAGRPGHSTSKPGIKVFLQSDAHGITTQVPELARSIDESSLMKKRSAFFKKNCFLDEGESNALPAPACFFQKKIK